MWVLWVICVLFYLTEMMSEKLKIPLIISVIIVAIVLFGCMALFDTKLFALHLITLYFPIYAMGYFFRKHNVVHFINSSWAIFGLGIVWFVLASFWNMEHVPCFLDGFPIIPHTVMHLGYRFMTSFVGILFFLPLFRKLFNKNSLFNNRLSKLGIVSMGIYTSHMLWGSFLNKYVGLCSNSILLNIAISFITISLLSIMVVHFIKRNKLLSIILLGKI